MHRSTQRHTKWLLRKSRKGYKYETRTSVSTKTPLEEMPKREGMGKSHNYLDTTLLARWLQRQVGRNFNDIYANYLERIQPKYIDTYRDQILNYVTEAHEVVFTEDGIPATTGFRRMGLYIDPTTNLLCRYPQARRNRRPELKSKFGYFTPKPYSSAWELVGYHLTSLADCRELWIKGKELTNEQVHLVDNYLQAFKTIRKNSLQAIKNTLSSEQRSVFAKATKTIGRLHFQSQHPHKYTVYFEVFTHQYTTYQIEFNHFKVVKMEKLEKG